MSTKYMTLTPNNIDYYLSKSRQNAKAIKMCWCKKTFDTEEDAINAKSGHRPYHCPICHKWHLTTKRIKPQNAVGYNDNNNNDNNNKIHTKICRVLITIILLLTMCRVSNAQWFYYKVKPKYNSLYADIYSHCKQQRSFKQYNSDVELYMDSFDRITNIHEGTHGINSFLRQQYHNKYSCYYFGENIYALLPRINNLTLTQVANRIPHSLRDRSYQTYLVDSRNPPQKSWNGYVVEGQTDPEFILDELIAYSNSMIGAYQDNNKSDFVECLAISLEMCGYSLVITQNLPSNYDHKFYKPFIKLAIQRCINYYREADRQGITNQKCWTMLYNLQNNQDTQQLRGFCKEYFGKEWCHYYLGL
jgi:hypothetical protein